MIHLDTSFLIPALVPGSGPDHGLRSWLAGTEPVALSAIVWAEFLCGPVGAEQRRAASLLFPNPEPLSAADAERAADLFNATGRRRGSLADCLIAAVCLRTGASIATANVDDFRRFEPLGLAVLTCP